MIESKLHIANIIQTFYILRTIGSGINFRAVSARILMSSELSVGQMSTFVTIWQCLQTVQSMHCRSGTRSHSFTAKPMQLLSVANEMRRP